MTKSLVRIFFLNYFFILFEFYFVLKAQLNACNVSITFFQ